MHFFVLGSYMNANFMKVHCLPAENESHHAHAVWQEHGGKGLNLGVGLHRLGIPVTMLLGVGRDHAGEAVHNFLSQENMNTRGVVYLGEQSGYGVGFIDAQGKNFLAAFPGANALIDTHHVESQFEGIDKLDWVCAQFECPEAAILRAFELAKTYSARTYLNPSPWHMPSPELMALTDVLVVNTHEAALVFNAPEAASWDMQTWSQHLPDMVQQLAFRHPLIVVTLGCEGVLAFQDQDKTYYQPAWPIEQIDATGAGDAFGCGLLWGLSRDLPMAQTLQFANACGALVAASSGVLAALPHIADVEAFLQMHQPTLKSI